MVVSMVADIRMMRTSGKAWTTSLRTTSRKSVCSGRNTVRNLRAVPVPVPVGWTHVDVSLVDLINDDVADPPDSCFQLPEENTWRREHLLLTSKPLNKINLIKIQSNIFYNLSLASFTFMSVDLNMF